MGNSPSALQTCLSSISSTTNFVSYPSFPLDPVYQLQSVKPYNLDIPIVPAAVTKPKTPDQIASIIKCAVSNNVKVQARSGGHSYGNYGLGGTSGAVVVDLVNFKDFSIDKNTWQATIGAGTLLEDVTKKLHDNGNRAMSHGTCPQVGIGGHATIGGLGPTSRLWGSALDHVQEVQVVLANSTITRASEKLHPDLFFALKGAAAGFGIITEFKVRTEPEPKKTVQYQYTWTPGKFADMAGTFEAWQTMISDPELSRKFASQVLISPIGMIIQGTYFGDQAEYDALGLEDKLPRSPAFKSVVLKDWLGNVAQWVERSAQEFGGGIPAPFYSKSLAFTNETLLGSSTIKDLFKLFDDADKGSLVWAVIFDLEGGAVNDVPTDATAYGHRDALFYIQSYIVGIPKVSQKSKDFLGNINGLIEESMPQGTEMGAYAGYVDPALKEGDAQERYWGANYRKLQRVKRGVDPGDVFWNPQSVRPAPA